MRDRFLFILLACSMMVALPSFHIDVELDAARSSAPVSGRATCVDAPNVATIEFVQPNPVSLPSHETLLIEAVLKDASGTPINIDPDWGTDRGSIQNFSGLQQARFTPGSFGVTNIWACAGAVNETLVVNVLQGAVAMLHLETEALNVTADDSVVLNLTGEDIRGNIFSVNPPKQNWTLPSGTEIVIGPPAIWTPGPVGSQNISVEHAGLLVMIQLNVSHGIAIDLLIDADSVLMTADETLDLDLVLIDAAGNTWAVEGNWSTQQPEAAEWLTAQGSSAVFDAYKAGSWTILAEHTPEGANQSMPAVFVLQVLPGNLSTILLFGQGMTLSVDDVLDLNPRPVDSAENLLGAVAMTWTINDQQATNSLTESGYVFSTEVIGHYVIEVQAEGGSTAVIFDVVHGAAVRLVITAEGSTALIANSGESLELLIEAEDQYANRYVTNAEFELAEGVGTILPSSSGTGYYEFQPIGVKGFVMVNVSAEGLLEQILIDVQAGAATKLGVEFDGELRIGNEVRLTIRALDESDNVVTTCDAASTVVMSPNGVISQRNGLLYLDLDTAGAASMTVGCLGLQDTFYFEVESVILGGMFGDFQQTVMYASVMLMVGITVMLVLLILRRAGAAHIEDTPIPVAAPRALGIPNPAAAPVLPNVPPAKAVPVPAPASALLTGNKPTPPAIFTANRQAREAIQAGQYPGPGDQMHTPITGYGLPGPPHGMIPVLQLTPSQIGMLPPPRPLVEQSPLDPMAEAVEPTEQIEESVDALGAAKHLLSGGGVDSEEEAGVQPPPAEGDSEPESEPAAGPELTVIEIPELDFEEHPDKSGPETEADSEEFSVTTDEDEEDDEDDDDDWDANW